MICPRQETALELAARLTEGDRALISRAQRSAAVEADERADRAGFELASIAVCSVLGSDVAVEELRCARGNQRVVAARELFCKLASHRGFTNSEIGAFLGRAQSSVNRSIARRPRVKKIVFRIGGL